MQHLDLFVGNDTIYGQSKVVKKGKAYEAVYTGPDHHPNKAPRGQGKRTPEYIEKHNSGDLNCRAGLYVINEDGNVKCGALDIDTKVPRVLLQHNDVQLDSVQLMDGSFTSCGFYGVLFKSLTKGHHLWTFTDEWTPWQDYEDYLHHVAQELQLPERIEALNKLAKPEGIGYESQIEYFPSKAKENLFINDPMFGDLTPALYVRDGDVVHLSHEEALEQCVINRNLTRLNLKRYRSSNSKAISLKKDDNEPPEVRAKDPAARPLHTQVSIKDAPPCIVSYYYRDEYGLQKAKKDLEEGVIDVGAYEKAVAFAEPGIAEGQA